MNNSNRISQLILIVMIASLTACGGSKTVKPEQSAPVVESSKDGGYYLDDGPGENAPSDLDSIPDATPKVEAYSTRANNPYIALGQKYTPMQTYTPYKKQGTASWYGKRYHGKKTSIGEVYDMYAMTAAHPTLPIPSYARVKNVINGRTVVVRINDRGPFIDNRLIDLSYAAAYKLRMIEKGSALVEVEAIDNSSEALMQATTTADAPVAVSEAYAPAEVEPMVETQMPVPMPMDEAVMASGESDQGYYLQVGAFQSEENSNKLSNKIVNFNRPGNVEIFKMYNKGLYRVKLGPYQSQQAAEAAASEFHSQYGIKAIVQDIFSL